MENLHHQSMYNNTSRKKYRSSQTSKNSVKKSQSKNTDGFNYDFNKEKQNALAKLEEDFNELSIS